MELKRVIKALEKNGCEVKQTGGIGYVAIKGDKRLHFLENGIGSGQVYNLTYRSPDTKAEFDEFNDVYYRTIKSALAFFN